VSRATRSSLALGIATAFLASGAAAAVDRHDRAPSSCLHARIGGNLQCLTTGLACRIRYEHLYVLYGFTCKLGVDGRHRLRERLYIGPPVPAPDR
jgi:hypothetical protein